MDREVMQQFRRLPLRAGAIWQGKFLRMVAWVTDEQGQLFRPIVPLWVDARQLAMSALGPIRPEEAEPSCLLSRLLMFAVESRQFRPGCIEVSDAAVARYLELELKGCEIEVRLVEQMAEMDKIEADLARLHRRGATRVSSLLETPGVEVKHLEGFAQAASAFYRAKLWLQLLPDDLIQVNSPSPPSDMKWVCVTGADRTLYGIELREKQEDHYRYLNHQNGWQDLSPWQLSFGRISWIPIEDASLWEDCRLEAAAPDAYPRLIRYDGPHVLRPSADQLVFLEGLLQVLATTTPAQLDRGRWTRSVLRSDGQKVKYCLSLPDLVRRAAPDRWTKRGYRPDARLRDYLQLMEQLYSSRRIDSLLDDSAAHEWIGGIMGVSFPRIQDRPSSDDQQARALSYQACETFGRQRRKLAEQALQLDPQCVEAHVLLGELAPTLDLKLQHYRRAVAAGSDWAPGGLAPDDEINLWAVTTDQTHLRARHGLAVTLEERGQFDEAIQCMQEILELDPADRRGVRFMLLPRLMSVSRDLEAARLLKAFDEQSTHWAYAQAILAFRLSGDSQGARREMQAALQRNPHLPRVLTAVTPPVVSDRYAAASPEEATICIEQLLPALTATPGIVDWMVAEHRRYEREQNAIGATPAVERHRQRN